MLNSEDVHQSGVELGHPISRKQAEIMIRAFDEDLDDKISFEEFQQIITTELGDAEANR